MASPLFTVHGVLKARILKWFAIPISSGPHSVKSLHHDPMNTMNISSSIKDRNGMDLTEAEDVKKRWQEYTEELYEKIFTTQIITMV